MKNKLILTIILGMFLISLVSATVTIILNSPADNVLNISNLNTTFVCSAITKNDELITNISFWNDLDGWKNIENVNNTNVTMMNITNSIGTGNALILLKNISDINMRLYNVSVWIRGTGGTGRVGVVLQLNYLNGTSINSTLKWTNEQDWSIHYIPVSFKNKVVSSIYTWGNSSGPGSIIGNETYIGTNATLTSYFNQFISDDINWNCMSCDTSGDCAFAPANYTFPIGPIINSINYSSSVYETQQTSYAINISANSSLTSVKLYLNGTPYTPTQSGNIWNYTFGAIPSSKIGNNSVIFGLNYSGTEYNTTTYYQTISPIQFGICNATLTVPYWNISFKDESTLSSINGTIQSSTFVYYLGNGTANKTLSYSVSTNASSYRFCSLPADRPYYVLPDVNYLLTGYPTRIYNPSLLTLTNSTTNTTLYLLSSADGIYVTFITASTSNTPISDVDIVITRELGGTTTTIFSGLTDSAGSVTIWLNPNYDHKITASKTGYTTNIQTVKPALYQYTLTMETALDSYEYVSDRKGLKWFAFPASGVIKSTNYTSFGYNISAKNNNIVSCKLELLNSNKTTLITSAETFTTNGTLCSVSIDYSMNYSIVKGRLLVNLGDGYQILEDDAFWRLVQYNTTGSTMIDWFKGLSQLELSYFNNDEQHREYTYILLFFLVVMIICAVLNRMGWDIQTNGGMIFLVGILVWGASVPGFLTLNDLTPFVLVNKFFVAIVYSMFMIGFAMRELT